MATRRLTAIPRLVPVSCEGFVTRRERVSLHARGGASMTAGPCMTAQCAGRHCVAAGMHLSREVPDDPERDRAHQRVHNEAAGDRTDDRVSQKCTSRSLRRSVPSG